LTEDEKKKIIWGIISDWYKLHDIKKIKDVLVKYENGKIYLIQKQGKTIYNIEERKIGGFMNDVAEDLRDYMRRRGIKIYTDKGFRSI
jgi:dissimilatory sulfite reductase (desulfoviridin) alpha/beta subunit